MALKFDITGDPPALADIVTEREQALRDRALLGKKNIRFLITTATVVLSLLSIAVFVVIPTMRNPAAEPSIVAVTAYFTPYLIFPVFVIGLHLHNKHIEKPSHAVTAIIKALKEVAAEELSEVVGTEQQYAEIDAYRGKVAVQGRSLVQAEIDAAQRWLDERKKDQ